jgi:hypothetical protein
MRVLLPSPVEQRTYDKDLVERPANLLSPLNVVFISEEAIRLSAHAESQLVYRGNCLRVERLPKVPSPLGKANDSRQK